MTPVGIVLVLLSALSHASWTVLTKSGGNPVEFVRRALRYSMILYLPLFVALQWWARMNQTYLLCMAGSGLASGLMFYCMGQAYRHGHISVAYPIFRSFPILVVSWAAFVMGRAPTGQALAGIVFVVSGCVLLPMQRFGLGPGGLQIRNYISPSALWAVGAASAVSAMSIIDKYAAVAMPADSEAARAASQISYVYLQNVVSYVVVACLYRTPSTRSAPRWACLAAGAIMLISYSLVIMALRTDPVAYVVSFRQISIVIGSVVSMLWIEKRFSRVRLVGILIVFLGVLLVGLARAPG